eukprot:5587048-Prymnesium_polylepis.1
MDYPADKITVHVLDDGRRAEVVQMVERVNMYLGSQPQKANLVRYHGRVKKKGVAHHAKAGNINTALLAGATSGAYVLVLDCDMVCDERFLRRVMGHFLEQAEDGTWREKPKAAFVQTPQDFYNIDGRDALGHAARFFYGPMLQGRDGVGACPCVGTGVIFRRDVLMSIGGQSYGSITEDYYTAMNLMSCGFSTMFLNE